MNKYFLLLLFTIFSVTLTAQNATPKKKIIDFKKDILRIKNYSFNKQPYFFKDKGSIQNALYISNKNGILYLPAGVYTVQKSIQLFTSGLHIKGAGIGKTIVRFDSTYEGNDALFQSNGAGDLTIEGITFTGQSKNIKAVLEFNSYPNKSKNISILHCEFANLWVDEAVNFGGTASNETHSLDNININSCRFYNLFNPHYRVVTNDTDPKCVGINLQQTTLRAAISQCTFENISGDAIFGWGWSQSKYKANPLYGNWNIHHNYFSNCWMCIEVNGNGLGSGLSIHHNTMKYSTHNGGFLISVDGYKARIENNRLYNVDRSLIEYTAIEGVIQNNTGFVTTYMGQQGAVPPSQKFESIACVELYGYNNMVTLNNFTINRTKPNAFSPSEFNGIKLIGKTTDTLTQPMEYKNVKDYSAYWTIRNNTVTGYTKKAIDATNHIGSRPARRRRCGPSRWCCRARSGAWHR